MTNTMTCEQFDALLPGYMEGELAGGEREAFERHAGSCAHCRPILEELKAIVASAGALGPIEPPRELWSGIEARIGTQVVPLGSRRPMPVARTFAAGVVLMAVTAGVTWKLARGGAPDGQPAVASASNDQPNPTGTSGPVIVTTPPQVAGSEGAGSRPPRARVDAAKTPAATPRGGEQVVQAVRSGGGAAGTAQLYDSEITRLHAVIRQRRGELDPNTVAAIERSLAVIDTAIAQARSALARDPASRFLNGRLTDALDKKVELLRTTAMLPARS